RASRSSRTQIASWFPERIHQVDIELGRAQDLPNGVLSDMRCKPGRLIANRVRRHGDDRPGGPECLRVDLVEGVARLVMHSSILRGVHPQLQRRDAFEQEWAFI